MDRPTAPLSEGDRALVIRLGAVGDVVRALPAVRRLRRRFPALHIAWIAEDLARPLLEGHPDLDAVVRFPRRELRAARFRPAAFRASLRDLRGTLHAGRYTVAIDLQASLKSGLVALLSGARRRIGFAPGFSREASFLFATEWIRPVSSRLNRVDRNLAVAAALGAADGPVEAFLPETPEEAEAAGALASALRAGARPLVVASPGTSRRQAYKMWPVGHWSRLSVLLKGATGAAMTIAWGPGEEPLAAAVARAAAGCATVLPATSLRQLAALLRRADLCVAADTGPMHLAWAAGCPVVALFGPTDPRLNAPRGGRDVVVRSEDGTMASIAPERVAAAVARRLREDGRA